MNSVWRLLSISSCATWFTGASSELPAPCFCQCAAPPPHRLSAHWKSRRDHVSSEGNVMPTPILSTVKGQVVRTASELRAWFLSPPSSCLLLSCRPPQCPLTCLAGPSTAPQPPRTTRLGAPPPRKPATRSTFTSLLALTLSKSLNISLTSVLSLFPHWDVTSLKGVSSVLFTVAATEPRAGHVACAQ